jgi:hypothetical protein
MTVQKDVQYSTESAAPEKEPSPIEDLCSAIKRAGCEGPNACIGILANQWLCIWPPFPVSACSQLKQTVSLHELLIPGCLEKRDRLRLGVQLASAVMQLHNTNWLNECWDAQDIFFLQKTNLLRKLPDGTWIYDPAVDTPFVFRDFGKPKSAQPPTSKPPGLFQYDQSLFSLGIVLVELWFERPIDDLRDPSQAVLPFNESTKYEIAQRCVGPIFSTAGDLYGLAISHCLNGLGGPIGPTNAGTRSLENPKFKREVQNEIVGLLERNLEVGQYSVSQI